MLAGAFRKDRVLLTLVVEFE